MPANLSAHRRHRQIPMANFSQATNWYSLTSARNHTPCQFRQHLAAAAGSADSPDENGDFASGISCRLAQSTEGGHGGFHRNAVPTRHVSSRGQPLNSSTLSASQQKDWWQKQQTVDSPTSGRPGRVSAPGSTENLRKGESVEESAGVCRSKGIHHLRRREFLCPLQSFNPTPASHHSYV